MPHEKVDINNVQIAPVPLQNGLVAFASFLIDARFFVGNVAIFTSPSTPGGFRLVYPTKMGTCCFRPLSREVGDMIQSAVIAKYQEIMKKFIQDEEDVNERSDRRS